MSENTKIVLYQFRWWYKGITTEGNIIRLTGHVHAVDASTAMATVEKHMRIKHPDVRWMHGEHVETSSVRYGPTVQQLKRGYKTFIDGKLVRRQP